MSGVSRRNTLESGKTTRCMGKVFVCGLIGENMMGSIKGAKNMDMEFTDGIDHLFYDEG